MTLDEAIKHAEEVAEEKENEGKLLCQSEGSSIGCLMCAEEHRQLAEWLKDYKRLLEQEPEMGEWIDVGLTKEMYVRKCRCTNCGEWNIGLPLELPAYCGICGAKMTSDKYMLYGDEPFKVESE